jgi:hypothetical protein
MTEEYGRVEERKMEGKSTELEKNWDCGFSGYSLVPTRVFEVYKSMTCMKSFDDETIFGFRNQGIISGSSSIPWACGLQCKSVPCRNRYARSQKAVPDVLCLCSAG